MQKQASTQGVTQTGPPSWVGPVVVLALIVGLIAIGSKKEEAVANPLVDIAVISVGVAAFWWVFRWAALKLGMPGVATFFGAPTQAPEPGNR